MGVAGEGDKTVVAADQMTSFSFSPTRQLPPYFSSKYRSRSFSKSFQIKYQLSNLANLT